MCIYIKFPLIVFFAIFFGTASFAANFYNGVTELSGWYDAQKTIGADGNFIPEDETACWAATSANIIKSWHDFISAQYNELSLSFPSEVPNSSAQEIFDIVKLAPFSDEAGDSAINGVTWFISGNYIQSRSSTSAGAYWSKYYAGLSGAEQIFKSHDLSGAVKDALCSLLKSSISRDTRIGISMKRSDKSAIGHSITFWGLGASGPDFLEIYVTDSDDREIALKKYTLSYKTCNGVTAWFFPDDFYGQGNYYLSSLVEFSKPSAPLQSRYVSESGNDANSGLSWESPMRNLQTAIDALKLVASEQRPCKVLAKSGIYSPSGTVQMTGGASGKCVRLLDNISLIGGLNGLDDTSRTGFSTIKGDSETLYCLCAFDVKTVSVSGMKVDGAGVCAGLYVSSSPLQISDCHFTNCRSTVGAGACVSNSDGAMFLRCCFSNNVASECGGGLAVASADVVAKNCTFTKNSANLGGGVFVYSNRSFFADYCTIAENSSASGAGGLEVSGKASAQVQNSIIWKNSASEYSNASITYSHSVVSGLSNEDFEKKVFNAERRFSLPSGDAYGPNDPNAFVFMRESAENGGAGLSYKPRTLILAGAAPLQTDQRGAKRNVTASCIGAVEYDGVRITEAPEDITLAASGSNSVKIVVSNMQVSYTWFSASALKFPDESLTYASDWQSVGNLDTQEATLDNLGTECDGRYYTCVAKDSDGNFAFSEPIKIDVQHTFRVSPDGDDSNDGLTWQTSIKSIQKAIDLAALVASDKKPSEVWLKNSKFSLKNYVSMRRNVSIYGGFIGNELIKEKREKEHRTTLVRDMIYGFSDNYVIYNSELLTENSILDSVIITRNENVDTRDFMSWGSKEWHYNVPLATALINSKGCFIIQNSVFKNNCDSFFAGVAGAIANYSSENIKIKDTLFEGNVSAPGCGAISGNFILENCVFRANKGYIGGAVSGSIIMTNCSFYENKATTGGACYGNLKILNTSFYNNEAIVDGGAIAAESLTLLNSCVSSNIAGCECGNSSYEFGGGILIYTEGIILNSTISNNKSFSAGGGIALGSDIKSLVLKNSILTGNSSMVRNNIFFFQRDFLNSNRQCIKSKGVRQAALEV